MDSFHPQLKKCHPRASIFVDPSRVLISRHAPMYEIGRRASLVVCGNLSFRGLDVHMSEVDA